MNKIWGWVGAILATAEQTVPIFIHNPTSQQIEGVVMTEGNQLFATLAQMYAAAHRRQHQEPRSLRAINWAGGLHGQSPSRPRG